MLLLIVPMAKTFSYDEKKYMADFIGKIKNRNFLLSIFEYLKKHNKDLKYKENDNGVFIDFDNLSDKSYNYVHKKVQKVQKRINSVSESLKEESEKELNSYTDTQQSLDNSLEPKFKCSNKEKNLIKRVRYNKERNEMSEFSEYSESEC